MVMGECSRRALERRAWLGLAGGTSKRTETSPSRAEGRVCSSALASPRLTFPRRHGPLALTCPHAIRLCFHAWAWAGSAQAEQHQPHTSKQLKTNPRMAQMLRTYEKFADDEKARIKTSAATFLAGLKPSKTWP